MYTVKMLCHITLPYRWEECDDPISCAHIVHAEGTVESLNDYPAEWAEGMFSFTFGTDGSNQIVYYFDSNGELHNDDGPAVERSDGLLEWYQHGRRHRFGVVPLSALSCYGVF